MKTLFIGSVFVFLGFFLGVSVCAVVGETTVAPACADCQDHLCVRPPCCNGDVNGDGLLDLSDVVYTLKYIFSGGREPVCLESKTWPCALPATGQTESYVDGDDGFYKLGCSLEEHFVDNGDGTITDNCTGLMWQKTSSVGQRMDWLEAVEYCEDLELAGFDDWRLANVRELQSIVDYGRSGLSIDPAFIASALPYWSSTTLTGYTRRAWYVYFGNGLVGDGVKGMNFCVRAVRGRAR